MDGRLGAGYLKTLTRRCVIITYIVSEEDLSGCHSYLQTLIGSNRIGLSSNGSGRVTSEEVQHVNMIQLQGIEKNSDVSSFSSDLRELRSS
ncbi:hypothetical protein RRG08_027762 [Elysia crispata]|uniref:Uncharacterized protein n=1 Tax=Elysia crispata TaxID=231223 RepID=A0AAE1DC67_9GAST|nr:hypothetical protein RRG08_027762 [Elysia crispata]